MKQISNRKLKSVLCAFALAAISSCLLGCDSQPTKEAMTPPVETAKPTADGSTAPPKGGNVMDTSVQGAPAGVKTGLEGGKK